MNERRPESEAERSLREYEHSLADDEGVVGYPEWLLVFERKLQSGLTFDDTDLFRLRLIATRLIEDRTPRLRHMKDAPKDGTTILAYLSDKYVWAAIRWVNGDWWRRSGWCDAVTGKRLAKDPIENWSPMPPRGWDGL